MIMTFLTKYREAGLLLLRVGLGVIFILHGWPLLVEGPKEWIKLGAAMRFLHVDMFLKYFGLAAAVSEVAGGALMILGCLFRPACLLMAFTMTVATIMHFHKHDDFDLHTSHSLSMAIVFYCLLLIGPGKYSVDKQ
ncbi:MAG: DoxX family protein [Chthoniobacteraceae bacterium]